MDLAVFAEGSFDPKDWINSMFHCQEAKDVNDIKQYASSMVMRLQLAIQEVNSNLEGTSNQVMSTIPRVLRDVEALSQEANILRTQMKKVKEDIERVESNTASSMQTLVELDTLKTRLTASSQALKEADNWTTLSSDIEEIMDSGDLDGIWKQLVALQNCLLILTHVPDYEDRVAHLDGLKVRFEALASPHLVSAFTQHNLENSKKYAKMLHTLGRSKNLESFYHKCELQQMMTIWSSGVEGHLLSGPPTWLTSFYDKLATLLDQQVKWCEEVFEGDSSLLLAELTYTTLISLDPSISKVVSIAIKQQDEPLHFLSSIKAATDAFLRDYQKSLLTSSSVNKSELYNLNREVMKACYNSLKEQMSNYQDYEESVLLSHLVSADLMKRDMSENLQRIREYCSKLSTQVESSTERCIQLTDGMSFPSLIQAVNTYVSNFNERVSQISRNVEQQKISIQDDWTVFNSCLSLIQASGELLIAVDHMEHILGASFNKCLSHILWETLPSDPFQLTVNVLLSSDQEMALSNLKIRFVDDDEMLLEASHHLAQEQCEKSVDVALTTIMAPVSTLLAQVPGLLSWNAKQSAGANLSVSLSPQEYVTQIGQYLMTLPQHLDPLLVAHSPALNRALQEANTTQSGVGGRVVSESEVSAADFLINSVGQSTCRLYTDVILRIPEVSPNMITQLTTDIDYVCNILEDLGVTACDPLDKLNLLLKAPPDKYWTVSPGINPRLIAAIRQIRNIPTHT